jgi:hypothetical protein
MKMSKFFWFCVPAVLGVAASVWLGVYIQAHVFEHQISQEDRAASYTGAAIRPTSKIKVEALNKSCIAITSADIDGNQLLVYSVNHCHRNVRYSEYHWEALSPDGTAIASSYENWKCPTPREPDRKAECSLEVSDDDRIVTIKVWTEASME